MWYIKRNYNLKKTPRALINMQYRNTGAGFTFIEVVAAVAIVGLVIATVFAVIQGIMADHHLAASRLQAAYLAQEKIEEIRNQRDENWLQGSDWLNNINLGPSTEPSIPTTFDPNPFEKFTRATDINQVGNRIDITVVMSWEDGRGTHDLNVQTKLYDWYPSP